MDLPDDFDSTSLLNWAEEGSGSGSGGRSFTSSIEVVGDADLSSVSAALGQQQQQHQSASAANATTPGPSMNDASSVSLSLSMFLDNGNCKDSNTTTVQEGRSLLHIGHHPLAMTSLASCPPYPAVATLGGGGNNCGNDAKCDVGNRNVQQQQQQQPLCLSASSQQQQQAATASSSIMFINNYINSYRNNQNNTNNSTSNNNNFFTSVGPTTTNDGGNNRNGSTVNNVGANANNNFGAMPTTGYDFSSGNINNNIINYNNNNSSDATSPHISNALAVAAVVAANTASSTSSQQQQQQQSTQFANHLRELQSNFQDSYATMPPPSMSLPMPMQILLQQQLQHHTQQQQQHHHYGITVNGFHPQVNAQTNHVGLPLTPLLMATTAAAATTTTTTSRVGGHQPQQKLQTGTTGTALVCAMASSATPCSSNYQIHHPVAAPGGNATNIGNSCATSRTMTTTSDLNALALLNSNNPAVALSGVYIHNNSSITATPVAATSTDMSNHTAVLHSRNSRDRNEREQVRAKKITQLITELRDNMQGGGWRVEMKSKYQVLSQLSVLLLNPFSF